MAELLAEIQWGAPILQAVADPAWEAEIKRRGGRVGEVDRRVTPSPWLREVCLQVTTYRPTQISPRLTNIGMLVISQENSCRYCYGANRAYMKILGYPESFISRLERDTQLAELDAMERGFIAFCRNLARSRPRPAKAERETLLQLGYAPLAVNEIALLISLGCFYNRIGILTACPPEFGFERMANGFVGRLLGFAAPMLRSLTAAKSATPGTSSNMIAALGEGAFGSVVSTLAGLNGATTMKAGLDGAFASTELPRHVKALMFAVVGRTLGCRHTEAGARQLLATEGFSDSEFENTLASLDSKRVSANESRLLSWVRDTVYYQTGPIQNQTRALAADIGEAAMLEAIGVAALANGTVRLAMLLE